MNNLYKEIQFLLCVIEFSSFNTFFFLKKENVLKEENVLYVFWFFCWHWLKTLIDI